MVEIGNYLLNVELISIVLTPIISLIAVFIYAKALKNSKDQNNVLLSQNIKPNFEKEIDFLIIEGDKNGMVLENLDFSKEKKTYKISGVLESLYPYIRSLANSEEFQTHRKNRIELTEETIKSKNYSNEIFWTRHIIYRTSKYARYFENIELFLKKVEASRMINEDEYAIKNRLRRLVLEDIIQFYNGYYKETGLTEMLIPVYTLENHKTEWRKLEESHLFNSIENISKMISR